MGTFEDQAAPSPERGPGTAVLDADAADLEIGAFALEDDPVVVRGLRVESLCAGRGPSLYAAVTGVLERRWRLLCLAAAGRLCSFRIPHPHNPASRYTLH